MRCQWWEDLRQQCGNNATTRVRNTANTAELLVCDKHAAAETFPPEVIRERLEK